MNLSRTSGVQLHPTSLPSGRLGPDAYAWVDWLASAGQTWWQMLPLGPPDEHDSPYKSASAFAASPQLLGSPAAPVTAAERLDFRERASDWIEDWLAFAGEDALDDQVRFDREWAALRAYAAERGVKLIGDIPIYVARGLGRPARAPGDLQGRRGRRRAAGRLHRQGPAVGQPAVRLARAAALRGTRGGSRASSASSSSSTWRGSTTSAASCAYWAVPADAEFALSGTWKRGPGRAPFDAARAVLGELPLIAEDLGVITPPVDAAARVARAAGHVRAAVRLHAGRGAHRPRPGEQLGGPGRLHRHARLATRSAAGTSRSPPAQRELVAASLARRGIADPEIHWALIRLVFASPAVIAMIQVQDASGLGSEGRMNQPGSVGAWGWRLDLGDVRRCAPGRSAARGCCAAQLEEVRALLSRPVPGDPSSYGPRRQWEIVRGRSRRCGPSRTSSRGRAGAFVGVRNGDSRVVKTYAPPVHGAATGRERPRMPGSDGAVLGPRP